MHGGKNYEINPNAFEDVYILSVPAFRWINVTEQISSNAAPRPLSGSMFHRCVSWLDRTMVVLNAGKFDDDNAVSAANCDESQPPVKILDTSDLAWLQNYDPQVAQKPYTVPAAVYNIIGGK